MDYPAYFRNESEYYRHKKLKKDLVMAAERIELLERIIADTDPDFLNSANMVQEEWAELHKRYYPENY